MAKSTAVQPGSVIAGKYRVERQLGSGGMGVVVEATHLALGQRVAVKLLDRELASAGENVARFFREARVAASLPSEHIARVSDVGQAEDGAPYLVMELLVGDDLAAEIARAGRLAVADAVDWTLQACEGLADAHAAGVVHRDVKPQNLFLARRPGRPPVLKILDFGLTKEAVREGMTLTQPGSIFGTPQYMAPEQVLDSQSVDARCDQHALGMVLYEALTGRPPYEGTAASQLFVVIVTAPPPSARALRAEVPRALDQAIVRALAKKPDERFPSLAEMAEAIAPFGGPPARAVAANVRRVLVASGPGGAARAYPATAVPAGAGERAGRDPAPSGTDLTSSSDHGRRGRKNLRIAVAGGLGVVAVAGVAAVMVVGRYGAPVPAASALTAASPPPAPSASSPAVPPASAPVPAEAAAPASAATAPSAAPRGSSRPAPASPVRKAIGVFGGERR